MEKSDLRPGMWVRNTRSGNEGQVCGKKADGSWSTEKGSLTGMYWCVGVRTRTEIGKKKGKYRHTFWDIKNLEFL